MAESKDVGLVLIIVGLILIVAGIFLALQFPNDVNQIIVVAKGWVDGFILSSIGLALCGFGVKLMKSN
jgi:uncharacterized membrane protein